MGVAKQESTSKNKQKKNPPNESGFRLLISNKQWYSTRAPNENPISVIGLRPWERVNSASARCWPTSVARRVQMFHGLSMIDEEPSRIRGHAIADTKLANIVSIRERWTA